MQGKTDPENSHISTNSKRSNQLHDNSPNPQQSSRSQDQICFRMSNISTTSVTTIMPIGMRLRGWGFEMAEELLIEVWTARWTLGMGRLYSRTLWLVAWLLG